MNRWIKNFDELATTPNRRVALEVVESGIDSIDTEKVIQKSISLNNESLMILGYEFDLSKYKSVNVIGFGKASCKAALALEKVIGPRISDSAVVGATKESCQYINTYQGTHPEPSLDNVEISKKICELGERFTEDDLVIVIISGGGSALLCYPETEYSQGKRLYQAFLDSGGTIDELNTVRKHISALKGGGLAKILYPATVVGLLFSDVPGNKENVIASGPTCKEGSSVEDAQEIIDKYDLGEYELTETPKEDKYFEKVHNFLLVSNEAALSAMKAKAQELGFESEILSSELYDFSDKVIESMKEKSQDKKIVLAGGETKLIVNKNTGKGGRNLYLSLSALKEINENQLFISFASDGKDNSDALGAISDKETLKKSKDLDPEEYLKNFDSYTFFEKTGDLIFTGPTETNVSDLMILLEKKYED